MNPPIVYEETKPIAQRTSKMTAMVQSNFRHLPPLPSEGQSQRNGLFESMPASPDPVVPLRYDALS